MFRIRYTNEIPLLLEVRVESARDLEEFEKWIRQVQWEFWNSRELKKILYHYPEHATCCAVMLTKEMIEAIVEGDIEKYREYAEDLVTELNKVIPGKLFAIDEIEDPDNGTIYIVDTYDNEYLQEAIFKMLRDKGYLVVEISYGCPLHNQLNRYIRD